MNKLLSVIASMLRTQARARAEYVMRKQAEARVRGPEVYSANAGGWN